MSALARLEASLEPLAIELAAAAAELREVLGSDEVRSALNGEGAKLGDDSSRLCEAVGGFRESLKTIANSQGGNESEEGLRSARHEWKNHLNHIVGPAQFIAMEFGGVSFPKSLESVLSLCHQCLSAINGSHEIRSSSDPGAEFSEPLKTAEFPGRILVADDDRENRELLARLLEAMGHEIVFAVNGREALDRIRSDAAGFDAVLLDIRMPEMDGFEVLERLRESGHLRHTPVIVVTGLQEERDAVRCIEIGAEDFLSRPIRPALLTARLNATLEKKRLREKVFEQHFTPELAREFARNPDLTQMKGRVAEVSVLFCDIRGFSAVSERIGPEQTIDWLGDVMGEFSGRVIDHGGVLVDYTGDELLAMWGAPGEQPDHAERACRTALEMLAALPELNARWDQTIGAETAIGIGISTGPALVGNIGTHRKFKYGPLGTTVNLGSRIQGATKFLGTTVLVSGDTLARLDDSSADQFPRRRLCRVRVRNIREPVEVWEIVPPSGDGWNELCEQYEAALTHFESEEFHRASAILGELLVRFPGDGPSLVLMSRVVDAMLGKSASGNGSGGAFDPVWELPGK
ncbi:MAG: response regulator [Verrucomicrobiae bacterium]|nr:response regulator [Verrucomicrobiae bacterium]